MHFQVLFPKSSLHFPALSVASHRRDLSNVLLRSSIFGYCWRQRLPPPWGTHSQPHQQTAHRSFLPCCRQPITARTAKEKCLDCCSGEGGITSPLTRQAMPGESSLSAFHKYIVLLGEKRDCHHKQVAEKMGFVQRQCSKRKGWH